MYDATIEKRPSFNRQENPTWNTWLMLGASLGSKLIAQANIGLEVHIVYIPSVHSHCESATLRDGEIILSWEMLLTQRSFFASRYSTLLI